MINPLDMSPLMFPKLIPALVLLAAVLARVLEPVLDVLPLDVLHDVAPVLGRVVALVAVVHAKLFGHHGVYHGIANVSHL